MDPLLESISELLESAQALSEFRKKHGAFLGKHLPFLVMSEYKRVTFHGDDAPAVAAYFGNGGWIWNADNESCRKEVDGVTVSVCSLKQRPPVYQTLVPHLDEIAAGLHEPGLHSLN